MKKIVKILKISLIVLLIITGITTAFTWYALNKPGVIILMYHKIGNPKPHAKIKGLYVTPERFEGHIVLLKKLGFSFITYRQYLENKNNNDFFKKKIMITVDDGYEDNYTNMFPILKKHVVPAHIFMITGAIGARNYTEGGWDREKVEEDMLTEAQIKEMYASGLVFFGSHCVDHKPITEFNDAERIGQLKASKERLELLLDTTIDMFAFPIGVYTDAALLDVEKSGYSMTFTTDEGRNYPETSLYQLKRIGIAGWFSDTDIIKKCALSAF